jgi:hypothetical protein
MRGVHSRDQQISFDLAVGLGMIGQSKYAAHSFGFKILAKILLTKACH